MFGIFEALRQETVCSAKLSCTKIGITLKYCIQYVTDVVDDAVQTKNV